MKRYRALSYDMDFRASHLSREIKETWEPEAQEMHRQNRERLVQGFVAEFGEWNAEAKIQNLIDLGDAPFTNYYFPQ